MGIWSVMRDISEYFKDLPNHEGTLFRRFTRADRTAPLRYHLFRRAVKGPLPRFLQDCGRLRELRRPTAGDHWQRKLQGRQAEESGLRSDAIQEGPHRLPCDGSYIIPLKELP